MGQTGYFEDVGGWGDVEEGEDPSLGNLDFLGGFSQTLGLVVGWARLLSSLQPAEFSFNLRCIEAQSL